MNFARLFRRHCRRRAGDSGAAWCWWWTWGCCAKAALCDQSGGGGAAGVVGCGAAMETLLLQGNDGLSFQGSHELLLTTGGFTAIGADRNPGADGADPDAAD